jgi:branched-chain amino acid transport system ATP-binding protein
MTPNAAAPALEVQGLGVRYGALVALDDVSWEVRPGELLGIIGPNGAGKTVLINTVSGFYAPDEGTIRLNGRDVTALPLHERGRLGIARTFQNIRVFRRMTVLENVMMADPVHARRPLASFLSFGAQKRERERAMRFIEMMGLVPRIGQLAGTLPYGEARRLEIARALATGPKLLLLDEPAAGMNEEETAELIEDVRKARPLVLAIALIEQDMTLIQALSDRVLAVDFGRPMAEGTAAQVLADPNVQRAYLGEEGST